MYEGAFASCYYTASNGGQIARPSDIWGGSEDDGYIEMKDDPYDLENPRSLVNGVSFSADLSDCAALRAMLEAALAEQLDGAWELVRVEDIEPVDPAAEGSYMYRGLRFALAVRVQVPAPHGDAPRPRPRPPHRPPASTPASSAAPTAEPIWEMRTVEVELSVYDQIKDELAIGLNGGDYELISVTRDGGSLHAGDAPLRSRRRHEPARRAVDGGGIRRNLDGDPPLLLPGHGAGAHRLAGAAA